MFNFICDFMCNQISNVRAIICAITCVIVERGEATWVPSTRHTRWQTRDGQSRGKFDYKFDLWPQWVSVVNICSLDFKLDTSASGGCQAAFDSYMQKVSLSLGISRRKYLFLDDCIFEF